MITTPLTAELVHGAMNLELVDRGVRPHRLPRLVRERFADQQLKLMEAQPSGVRVAFFTTARSVSLEVHATRVTYQGIKRARGALDFVIDGAFHGSHVLAHGDFTELNLGTGTSTFTPGDSDHVLVEDLVAGEKTVEIWLPHNEQVDLVALHTDEPVRPAPPAGPVWLHHGSSVSHGSNATSPTRIWPVVAARRAGVRLRNLGFGGSALVDPFMARVMRDTEADVISVKLGLNVVNLDAMRLRSFVPAIHGFLDTIRDGHPTTPLLLISPLYCAIHENTPGPGAFDPATFGTGTVKFIATGDPDDVKNGRLTLEVVRQALEEVFAGRSSDANLHHLDGRALYSAADAQRHPLPDDLHPDTDTHLLIGERFFELAFGAQGLVSGLANRHNA
ncbi:SGNH/GDSL hydrolase family protein [Amycolatopsis magusensis]|uniref:SGNH/GDSL hydrolase family protein n=1 Tax=Amycolatopsis magusensis TaxID=882444 RepID=UPI0024A99735|nr:SGNH/GDSL hydrolase family protein [Amycolatopsis magusensis]MDI5977916.1 SGNH/GDSL hydrolase family protein [Amycolatopsis magusensis]